jgi:alanyl-tRNA synthetase
LKPWSVRTLYPYVLRDLIALIQGDVFPEITKKVDEIKEILDEEEESFSRTLDRGEKLFDQFATRAQEQGVQELNGKDVWRLYDTFGFPVDLTRLMAEELGLGINDAEFEAAQAWSKEASKASLKRGTTDTVKLDVHDIAALEKNSSVPKTDDTPKFGKRFDIFSLPVLTGQLFLSTWQYHGHRQVNILQQNIRGIDWGHPRQYLLWLDSR